MDYYADYIRTKMEEYGHKLVKLSDYSWAYGGPIPGSTSPHQRIQLEGIKFNINELFRCSNEVSRAKNLLQVKREITSFRKKLKYIVQHTNELLNPQMNPNPDSSVESLLINPDVWINFRERVIGLDSLIDEFSNKPIVKSKTL
ncbi:hypothetical protein HYT56_02415 [Candidatus Woesearchaeota archaeon]|nr:hypothetical protein [Candidatus Woesearchaeota archaeon]